MNVVAARRAAEVLVERLRLHTPVDVGAVAHALGIRVTEANLGSDVSGVLISKDGAVTICVHKPHHPNRKRFTVAHEIGHHVLRHQFEPGEHVHVDRGMLVSMRSAKSANGVDAKEIEANQFAAALLMPTTAVRTEIQRFSVADEKTIVEVARRFRVSAQAMTIRLAALGWI